MDPHCTLKMSKYISLLPSSFFQEPHLTRRGITEANTSASPRRLRPTKKPEPTVCSCEVKIPVRCPGESYCTAEDNEKEERTTVYYSFLKRIGSGSLSIGDPAVGTEEKTREGRRKLFWTERRTQAKPITQFWEEMTCEIMGCRETPERGGYLTGIQI